MPELFAIPPAGGEVIHIHKPGYEPSRKRRRSVREHSALCGVLVRPTAIPVADAISWTSRRPTELDRRGIWRWCRVCLGHAAEITGLIDLLVQQIAAHPAAQKDTTC
ncbi:hypothetical protein [Umezawaea tangerina]|uniref:Uncharacterized protein n=1 Tax=Umezawaea tangerina TaxID=84725 RepID=A0A2T0SPH5_9PSEU|nr:hypothetical protein [Umezawaea tangerina]PRY35310.1 hypothetical protein CLV43_114228 [Umezawaea tangerina]